MSRGGPLYENGESVVVIFSREQGVQLGLEKREPTLLQALRAVWLRNYENVSHVHSRPFSSRNSKLIMTPSTGGAKGCLDHRFRASRLGERSSMSAIVPCMLCVVQICVHVTDQFIFSRSQAC